MRAAASLSSGGSGRPTPTFVGEEKKPNGVLDDTIPWADSKPNQVRAKVAAPHHHHAAGMAQVAHHAGHAHLPAFIPLHAAHFPCPQSPQAITRCVKPCCCVDPCCGQPRPPTSSSGCTGRTTPATEQVTLFVDDACVLSNCQGVKKL